MYQYSIYLLIVFVIYVLYKYVFKVYFLMLSYQKQLKGSFIVDFCPLIGYLNQARKGRKMHQDAFHWWKMFTRNYPNKKGIIGNIGRKAYIELVDVTLAKEYYQKLYGHFEGDLDYFTNVFLQMGHITLGGMEGDIWKHHRGIIGYALNLENLKRYPPNISQITNFYMDRFNNDEDLTFKSKYALILGEVILRGFFGMSFVDKLHEGQLIQLQLLNFKEKAGARQKSARVLLFGFWITRLNIFKKDKEIRKLYDGLRDTFRELIVQRKEELKDKKIEEGENKIKSFLDYIIERNLEEEELIAKGEKNSYQITSWVFQQHQWLIQIGGILFQDTGANFLTCLTYVLSSRQDIYDKIYDEIKEKCTLQENMTFTYSQLEQFRYLDAFVKEGLRQYTPTPIQRQRNCVKDCQIGDVLVKKGFKYKLMFVDTIVDYFAISQAFSPYMWDKPDEFLPERWLSDQVPYKDCFAYVPFGIGSRNCVGQHLGSIIAKTVILNIISQHSSVHLNQKLDKLPMGIMFTYEPTVPLTGHFVKRTTF